MKIEVNDYIRTKNGIIGKIVELNNKFKCIVIDKDILKYFDGNKNYPCFNRIVTFEDIVKHSNHIIDLIEVGDYVDGCRVLAIEKGTVYTVEEDFEEKDVKNVVTKEQFNSVKYEV